MKHKHASLDKYDAYFPGKPHYVQDSYDISRESTRFHCGQSYVWNSYTDNGSNMGIQRKVWKVTGQGILVDSHYIGKSDNI